VLGNHRVRLLPPSEAVSVDRGDECLLASNPHSIRRECAWRGAQKGYEMEVVKAPGFDLLLVALFIDCLSEATPGDFTAWHLSWSKANATLKMTERTTWEAGQRSAWQSFWDSANHEIMSLTWNESWNADAAWTSNSRLNTTADRAKNSAADLVHLLRLVRELITEEQFLTLTENWADVVSSTNFQEPPLSPSWRRTKR
jgi:hypothetical protein